MLKVEKTAGCGRLKWFLSDFLMIKLEGTMQNELFTTVQKYDFISILEACYWATVLPGKYVTKTCP